MGLGSPLLIENPEERIEPAQDLGGLSATLFVRSSLLHDPKQPARNLKAERLEASSAVLPRRLKGQG